MLPKWHVLFGFVFCLLLWFFNFPIGALAVIWLVNFGIDIDHYIIYIINKKKWSLIKAYRFFLKLKSSSKYYFCFFHTIEFVAFLACLAFLDKLFYFILLAVLFHLTIDLIAMTIAKLPRKIIFFSAIARLITYLKK